MNLIVCCTMYQLINAANIVDTVKEEFDLLLVQSTDFSQVKDRLKTCGLFQDIYEMENYLPKERAYRDKMEEVKRNEIHKDLCQFMDYSCLKKAYQKVYMPIDDVFGKFLFYYLRRREPNVHLCLYEDGLASYIKNYSNRAKNDHVHHYKFGTRPFVESIEEYWLYEPELYFGSRLPAVMMPLPKINRMRQQLWDKLHLIFFDEEEARFKITAKYLYFVEAFLDKNVVVEDMRLLKYISDRLGRDRLEVKLHPREPVDRFTPQGFKVSRGISLPWEALLLANQDLKIATFSFSSTAALTAKMVFGMETYNVFCCRLPLINAGYSLRDGALKKFVNAARRVMNEREQCLYMPSDFAQFDEILTYIEGKLHDR